MLINYPKHCLWVVRKCLFDLYFKGDILSFFLGTALKKCVGAMDTSVVGRGFRGPCRPQVREDRQKPKLLPGLDGWGCSKVACPSGLGNHLFLSWASYRKHSKVSSRYTRWGWSVHGCDLGPCGGDADGTGCWGKLGGPPKSSGRGVHLPICAGYVCVHKCMDTHLL